MPGNAYFQAQNSQEPKHIRCKIRPSIILNVTLDAVAWSRARSQSVFESRASLGHSCVGREGHFALAYGVFHWRIFFEGLFRSWKNASKTHQSNISEKNVPQKSSDAPRSAPGTSGCHHDLSISAQVEQFGVKSASNKIFATCYFPDFDLSFSKGYSLMEIFLLEAGFTAKYPT